MDFCNSNNWKKSLFFRSMTQLNFNIVSTAVDLLQVTQEQCGCTVQDLEQETRLFICIECRKLI